MLVTDDLLFDLFMEQGQWQIEKKMGKRLETFEIAYHNLVDK